MPNILSSFLVSYRTLRFGTKAVAAALLLSCGGGGGGSSPSGTPATPPPPVNTFYVGGHSAGDGYGNPGSDLLSFSPANLTIAAGTTVTWSWQGSGHSLDSGPGCSADNQFSSGGMQNAGYSMTHTFNTKGTFAFFCGVHCGSNMKGTITVQ